MFKMFKNVVGKRLLNRRSMAIAISAALLVSVSGIAYAGSGINRAKKIVAQKSKTQPGLKLPTLKKKPPKGKTVAWVFCTLPVCHASAPGSFLKKIGWKFDLYTYDASKGPSSAAQAFDRALAAKPDYIGYAGFFPDATLTKQLNAAQAAGIPVAKVVGDRVTHPAIKVCAACAPSRETTGRLQANIALADAGKKTSILYVYDSRVAPLRQSFEGAKSEVAKNGEGTKISPLLVSTAKSPAENAQSVLNELRRSPDIKYVLAPIGDLMSAVPGQLQAAGLSKKVKLIYGTPQKSDMAQLRAGKQFATVGAENVAGILRGVDGLVRLSVKEKIPSTSRGLWHQIITKKNAKKFGNTNPEPPGYINAYLKSWRVK